MKKFIIYLLIVILPIPIFAVDFNLAGQTFGSILTYVTQNLIGPLLGILEALAFMVFSYGVIKFVIKADNETELKKGKEYMIWGILSLFILLSLSSILGIIYNDLGFKSVFDFKVAPQLPTDQNSANITYPSLNP